MKPEFRGIERRLEKLSVCLQKLEPFKKQKKEELLGDPSLQDIIERNLDAEADIDVPLLKILIPPKRCEACTGAPRYL